MSGGGVTLAEAVGHVVVVLALIGAYLALTLTGHDGSPMLGVLGGYGGGAVTGAALARGAGRGGTSAAPDTPGASGG